MEQVQDYGFVLDFNLQEVPAALGLDVPPAAAAAILGIDADTLESYVELRKAEVAAVANRLLQESEVRAGVDALRRLVPRGGTIMAVGDSITAYRRGYAELLHALLAEHCPGDGLQVLNRGQSGYTTTHGLELTYMHLLAQQPDLVFIMYGANDVKHFGSPEARTLVSLGEYRENLASMVEAFLAHTPAHIVLLTPAPVVSSITNGLPDFAANYMTWDNADLAARASAVQDLAKKHDLACVDLYAAFGAEPDPVLYLPDGLHPGPAGQLLMLRTILHTIRRRSS